MERGVKRGMGETGHRARMVGGSRPQAEFLEFVVGGGVGTLITIYNIVKMVY